MHTIIDKGGKIMIKKYTVLIFSLVCLTPIFSQDYYWYGNQKVSLIPTDKKYVVTRNVNTVTATNVVESATGWCECQRTTNTTFAED